MLTKKCRGFLIGTILVFSTTAWGQSGVSIGPHLGIQKAQDADNTKYLVGGTIRARLLPALGAEGTISYRQEKYADESVTVKSWPVTVTGLLYPLPVLYGGVGAGWYNVTFDYNDTYNTAGFADETQQEFGWHLTGGLEIPVGPTVSIFGDVRYVFIDYEFADLPSAIVDDVNADFYSINTGLLFQL
jgi:hypothetical protein